MDADEHAEMPSDSEPTEAARAVETFEEYAARSPRHAEAIRLAHLVVTGQAQRRIAVAPMNAPKGQERVTVKAAVDVRLAEAIRRRALDAGTTMSFVVRDALALYFNHREPLLRAAVPADASPSLLAEVILRGQPVILETVEAPRIRQRYATPDAALEAKRKRDREARAHSRAAAAAARAAGIETEEQAEKRRRKNELQRAKWAADKARLLTTTTDTEQAT